MIGYSYIHIYSVCAWGRGTLVDNGFTAPQLLAGGYKGKDLKKAGFTAEDVAAAKLAYANAAQQTTAASSSSDANSSDTTAAVVVAVIIVFLVVVVAIAVVASGSHLDLIRAPYVLYGVNILT